MPEEKIKFTAIDGTSKGFWGLAALLFLLTLGGGAAALNMEMNGHSVTGMTNQIPWGLPIAMAVYLIGLSAGSLVLSALASVFGKKEFKPFARISATLAALLLVGALMAIILDWGRPDRLLVPFLHMNPRSMFSLNGILYSTYIALCFVYLWAMFAEKEHLVKVIGGIAVFWAVLVHSGTGAIFGFVGARELYHSPLLPPSFIAAALTSGTALMIIVLWLTFKWTNRHLDKEVIYSLGRYLAIFLAVVVYLIFVENVTRSYWPGNYHLQEFLLTGGNKYSWIFWLGMVGLGNVFPLIILVIPALRRNICWVLGASAMVVVGVLAERYIIVIPGQVMPLEILPGYEVTSSFNDGVVEDYFVSGTEVMYAVGITAFVFLAYLFVLKFFEMVPQTQAPAPPQTFEDGSAEAKQEEDDEGAVSNDKAGGHDGEDINKQADETS